MSKLAHSNQTTMDEIEQRSLFHHESELCNDAAFEILATNDINEITWSNSLNAEYALWQYYNLK